jgi:predicted dehydrogenase
VAQQVAPAARVTREAGDLLEDPEVDLVVVSTPPNTHASWASRALAAGKHVVLEKPMALTTAECDAVVDHAAGAGLLVVVYQNRRFDPDYRALRGVVRSGLIGEVFHLESFVGGYGHPCNYWHSDAAVSGGAIFDWGSHFLDQVLDLMPGDVQHVTAAAHKRRWHDVTNADQARVTLRFTDGREAEFVHSDLAAALKPKWLVLGTHGAVVGHWRTEKVVSRTAIGTLAQDVLAPADSPADLTVHAPDGSVTRLAVPPAPAEGFHRELADHLHRGLPMTVRAEHSRRVVAMMEAAEQSARQDGVPVRPR